LDLGGVGAELASVHFIPTRAAGLARLAAFVPNAGRAYARDRNVDRGPGNRANVSALSPWIRRRLITEAEVLDAVLARHSPAAAEKFIQEVYWRTYWKGWLEMRPGVLRRFNQERLDLRESLACDAALAERVQQAQAAATGIECFDAWVTELVTIGWLHNHARMWFASIWIFTLRLPWQLGADFFYKHLLDADPASNTLSWRWVAGLHTPGKHYLARAENIKRYTQERFDPRGQLDERAAPLNEPPVADLRAALPDGNVSSTPRVGVLLSEEDLHPESWSIGASVAGVCALASVAVADPAAPAARFSQAALLDARSRAQVHFGLDAGAVLEPAAVLAWAQALGVRELVTGYAPTGLIAWQFDQLELALAPAGVALVRYQRAFDRAAWPHASAGFFKLREKIPRLLAAREESLGGA